MHGITNYRGVAEGLESLVIVETFLTPKCYTYYLENIGCTWIFSVVIATTTPIAVFGTKVSK